MADTKISQLPAATTPLSGAEVVPLVQSGATVQTPVNDLSLLTAATANTFTANQIISVTDNTNAALRVTQLGTGLALRIEDSTNPDSSPFVIDASGNVGIGTASPSVPMIVQKDQNTVTYLDLANVAAGASAAVDFRFITQNAAGSGNTTVDLIKYRTGQFNLTNNETNANGVVIIGTASTSRLQIDTSGNILNISSGGLGYGTGSGGTVTQLTSKSTGVTLNKTNGQIVTSNAALAGSTAVQFSVTNSTVAATDMVLIQLASGDANIGLNYQVWVGNISAGSFVVTLFNRSGGSRSETLTLNFSIIKAVTS